MFPRAGAKRVRNYTNVFDADWWKRPLWFRPKQTSDADPHSVTCAKCDWPLQRRSILGSDSGMYSANAYFASYPLLQYVMYMQSLRQQILYMPVISAPPSHSHRCDKPPGSANALLLTLRYIDHSNWRVRYHCDVLKIRSSDWGDYVVITGSYAC